MKKTINGLQVLLLIALLSTVSFGQNNINSETSADKNSEWSIIEKNGLKGIINTEGEIIVKPEYEKIAKFGDYQTEWALIQKDGLIGFINIEGEVIVKPEYEKIAKFGDYQTDWALIQKDGLVGFINIDGEVIVKPNLDKPEPNRNNFVT